MARTGFPHVSHGDSDFLPYLRFVLDPENLGPTAMLYADPRRGRGHTIGLPGDGLGMQRDANSQRLGSTSTTSCRSTGRSGHFVQSSEACFASP